MIAIKNLSMVAGTFRLSDVSFEVPDGSYGVLMGRTGCGKTTILEAICGLRQITAGIIELAGRDVTRLKPAARDVGYVPQDGALFNTMTVADHLAFSLRLRKWNRREIRYRVNQMASLLHITRLLRRRPTGLSGGERQRVALGRALAYRPRILCLDEPLSALDDETRDSMCRLLKSVQEATGVTTLHVTHHRDEAQRLGDRILVFRDGQVETASRDTMIVKDISETSS